MPRVISFIVLLAITLLVGAVFFQVMAQFLVPLFLACVLLVVFQPLHRWLLRRLPTSPRVAAAITTVLIVLVVLLPTSWLGWKAFTECQRVYHMLQQGEEAASTKPMPTPTPINRITRSPPSNPLTALTERLSQLSQEYIGKSSEDQRSGRQHDERYRLGARRREAGTGILLGIFIMVVSLYYFLVDGPGMIQTLMQLSPLDPTYEQELLKRFSEISRAVVVATLSGAVVQGVAAGIGFYFALPKTAPIFLLTAATMVLAMVPFIGAIGVWVPTCVYILLYGERIVDGHITYDGNWHVALALVHLLRPGRFDGRQHPQAVHFARPIQSSSAASTVEHRRRADRAGTGRHLDRADARFLPAGALADVSSGIGPIWRSGRSDSRHASTLGRATASSANGGTPRPLSAEAPARCEP